MADTRPLAEGEVECSKCGARYVPDFMRDYYGGENGRGGLCESCMMREVFVKPDPMVVADENHLTNVCRPGKDRETCRYLAMQGASMICAKNSSLQNTIDAKVETMRAWGNNCSGPPDYKPTLPPV